MDVRQVAGPNFRRYPSRDDLRTGTQHGSGTGANRVLRRWLEHTSGNGKTDSIEIRQRTIEYLANQINQDESLGVNLKGYDIMYRHSMRESEQVPGVISIGRDSYMQGINENKLHFGVLIVNIYHEIWHAKQATFGFTDKLNSKYGYKMEPDAYAAALRYIEKRGISLPPGYIEHYERIGRSYPELTGGKEDP